MIEVEAKIEVDSIDIIREKIKEKSAVPEKITIQRDLYFNSPSRDFAETDEALRIRIEDGTSEVTYKGPKMKQSKAKAREEFNVAISSPEEMGNILEKLGFFKSAEVTKRREEFIFKGTKIALDTVEGLGEFVEIEVVTEDKDKALDMIEEVRDEIGISGEHISKSYLEMLQAKNNE